MKKKKTQRKPDDDDDDNNGDDNYNQVNNTTSNSGVNDDEDESADETEEEAKLRANELNSTLNRTYWSNGTVGSKTDLYMLSTITTYNNIDGLHGLRSTPQYGFNKIKSGDVVVVYHVSSYR